MINEKLNPDWQMPHHVRASLLAALAKEYSELSALSEDKLDGQFSVARALLAAAEGRELPAYEKQVCSAASRLYGQTYLGNKHWIPWSAIGMRAMGTIPGSKGGYLVGTEVMSAVDVLRPWSVVASSGATILANLRDSIVLPRVVTAVTGGWIGENSTPAIAAPPTLGNVSVTPHTSIALTRLSLQLLRQGEAVEGFLRAQLLRAVGELLDAAYYAGVGGVQPLGLHSTPGINTQSGTSVDHADLLEMKQKVLTAGGREENLRWVAPPLVGQLLGGRERATGSGFLLDDGKILNAPAHQTKNAVAGSLTLGDHSTSVVGFYGPGLNIELETSTGFNTAEVQARVLALVDVAFPLPSAFAVATSIT